MSEEKRQTPKTRWTILFVLLNIAVIAYIAISEFGGETGAEAVPEFSRSWSLYVLGALGCFAVLLLTETAKYAYMMQLLGQRLSWRTAFETAALGKYYDCITPSGIGGQPFQIYWLHKNGYSSGSASAMPVIGFITMQSGFILLACTVFLTWRSVSLEPVRYAAYAGLLAYAVVPCLLIAFSRRPAATEKLISAVIRLGARLHLVKNADAASDSTITQLRNYQQSIGAFSGKKKSVAVLLILSLLYQIAFCSIAWFSLMAMGGCESLIHTFAATVYIYASATIVATPGNSGAAEGVFYLVFSSIGSDGVFWAMLLWRLISYYGFIAVGGLIYGFRALHLRHHTKRKEL